MVPGPTEISDDLVARRREAHHAGPERAVRRQHERGKLTARQRIAELLDEGTFSEIDLLVRSPQGRLDRESADGDAEPAGRPYTDGVITGWGSVEGRRVFVFAQDFTVSGGSLGEASGDKVHKIMDMATRVGAPLGGLNDGAGARIQEGGVSLAAYGGIFRRNVNASGVIPQISVIMGPCAGGAVYSPAMGDFVFMVEGSSHMFITGPDVVKAVTGEEVSLEELGGAMTHATRSGVAGFVSPDEHRCLAEVRRLLSFLPAHSLQDPPRAEPTDDPERETPDLGGLLPADSHDAYDIRDVIGSVVDNGDMLECFARWAPNIVCGLARLDGYPVGIVANQPAVLAGVLDIDSSEKAARFVRTCDAFNLPLVSFVDAPGYRPGIDQEHEGIIRHGAKLLHAWCEATVPRIGIVVRKSYGGAGVVMNSRATGADLVFAWPSAELAVMAPDRAVDIIHRRDLDQSSDRAALHRRLASAYAAENANPYLAAERGYVDDVIDPARTRPVLIAALDVLRGQRQHLPERKHANVPL